MGQKWNNGNGMHLCDRCGDHLCEGFLPDTRYSPHWGAGDPSQHYINTTPTVVQDWDGKDLRIYDDYCANCAAILMIESDIPLVSVKEFYKV